MSVFYKVKNIDSFIENDHIPIQMGGDGSVFLAVHIL